MCSWVIGSFRYTCSDLSECFKGPQEAPGGKPVVLCLGASQVAGQVSADWVEGLRTSYPSLDFVNCGQNGAQAVQVLRRYVWGECMG